MINDYDIIIVGGGMVGASLALMLAKNTSLSILVLESQQEFPLWDERSYYHRVSAISLASQQIFKSLNVWDEIKNRRVSPFTKIQVWDAANDGKINFDSNEIASSVLGYIIENNVIQSSLLEKLQSYSSQVKVISPVKLVAYAENENRVELTDQNNITYRASLAIAADGARSWLREQAGITFKVHDYEQEAIVGTVTTTLPHEKIARQVFLETDPLAFLPLKNPYQSSIVWSLPIAEAKWLTKVDEDQFKLALTKAFSETLGDVVNIDQRAAFPLRRQQVDAYLASKIVLVGDAAHTMHPLAGQGINMGLLDAASLNDVIVAAINNRRNFSSHYELRKYERWRKTDNANLLIGVDVIKHLFASDKKIIQNLRAQGLNLTNRMAWIKNMFTRHAVGCRAGLPKLALPT